MRQLFILLILLLITAGSFGQKISQNFYSLGLNILKGKEFQNHYSDQTSQPSYFSIGVSHSWYRTDKKLSFNKEIGLNLQHSKLELGSGGLGGHYYMDLSFFNLFTEVTFQAQYRIDKMMSIGIGPVTEYLIIGYNRAHSSCYTWGANPSLVEQNRSGINRNYFGDPSLGIKLSILNFGLTEAVTFRMNLSYFWLKQNESNLYCSNLMRIGFDLAFKQKKNEPAKQ